MEWNLFLDSLNALNEWIEDIDIVDVILVNLVQKYQDPSRAPGLLRTQKGHVWINHSYILEQIPFLKIGIEALKKRLRHLVDVRILEREFLYPQTDNGIRKNTCYRLSELFIEMCEYYKAIQSVHSNKDLSEEDKQRKLAFLLKEKPEISRKVTDYRSGSCSQAERERDEKGRYRKVTDYLTQRYLFTLRKGNELPCIPPLYPKSKNLASKSVAPGGDHSHNNLEKKADAELQNGSAPPFPLSDAFDQLFGSTKGRSDKREDDIEELKRKIAEIKDLQERCKAKAHYRELGYDV